MKKKRFGAMVSLATIAALALSGCVSKAPAANDSAPAAATPTSCSSPAKGSPVDFWQIGDENPQLNLTPENLTAAKLAADRVNCLGGLNGHKLVIQSCNGLADPNRTADCARKATADPSTVAVWMFSTEGKVAYPILKDAKMPVVAPEALTPADFQYDYGFPVASGLQGLATGNAIFAHDLLHAKKVSVVVPNCVPCQGITGLVKQGLLNAGYSTDKIQVTKTVFFPTTVTDFSSYATQAAKDTDASLCFCGRTFTLRYVQTARQLGLDNPIIAVDDNVQPDDIKKMGAASKNLYYSAHFARNNPAGKEFVDAMTAAGAAPTGAAQQPWIAAFMLQTAAKGLTEVNSKTILQKLSSMSDYDSGGVTPTLNFTKPFTGFGGQLPRMFNPTVAFFEVKNGVPEQVGDLKQTVH